MKIVVQRVRRATCTVDGALVSQIGQGLLAFVGIAAEDTEEDLRKGSAKLAGLRIFENEEGKLSLSASDIGGEVMIISNFTLLGRVRRGFRPDCTHAARPEMAKPMYDAFCDAVAEVLPVARGVFGADMQIDAALDGPVNLVIDTQELIRQERNA
ncbi:MAG: D-tyrosyl-tRNA(Tyr) deacylase [Oscillospiraceae bacterium]|nr:D-tyrosyl-tRNA(Tyr) deacylase [Oscillospiraceae bacterium]